MKNDLRDSNNTEFLGDEICLRMRDPFFIQYTRYEMKFNVVRFCLQPLSQVRLEGITMGAAVPEEFHDNHSGRNFLHGAAVWLGQDGATAA